MRNWTQKEIDYLKKNYPKKLNKELGDSLKRSLSSINYRVSKHGLKKDYDFYCKSRKKYIHEFSKKLFEELYLKKKKSIREIAKEVGLGRNTVDYYLKKFKIPKRSRSEANYLGSLKYPNWKKGLNKEIDPRLKLMGKKIKATYAKKRNQKLKEIEEEWNKPLSKLINDFYWKENHTQEKIAKKLKLSRDLVIQLMKDHNISKRPNFEFISSLKGKNHSMYGKKWEDIYGVEKAKKRKERLSLKMRKNMIKRLKNKEIPFLNTKIEKKIAYELTRRSIPFIHQYPVDKKFVCDFALPVFDIIIECDGDYWHANPKIYEFKNLDLRQNRKVQTDRFKDKYLKKKGWKVFRFFETEINRNLRKCMDKIEKEIKKQLKNIKNPLDNL